MKQTTKEPYTIAETFVGAGGSHLGFKNNGFKTVYLNEFNLDCIKTLQFNNPEIFENVIIDCKDIRVINFHDLESKLKNKVDVLFGGIVCKGFSLAGERCPIDDRNYLYLKQLELVRTLNPKVSVIENVPALLNAKIIKKDLLNIKVKEEILTLYQELENIKGIKAEKRKKNINSEEENIKMLFLRSKKKQIIQKLEDDNLFISVVEDIIKIYHSLNYRVYLDVLNASCYGSSTARDRIVIVAIRNDVIGNYTFPAIAYCNNINKTYTKTGIEVLKDYKPLNTVQTALNKINYSDLSDVDNHSMQHNEKTIQRFSLIPEGQNIQDVINTIPQELEVSKFYSRGCTMRLDRNKPSPTLVPGHSNFPIHPMENRSITVREASVITGFPLNYKFFGSHTSRCEQVGNAVPIELSTAIAKSVKHFLDNSNV